MLGTDLTQIHNLDPSLALKLVAECGTDLGAFYRRLSARIGKQKAVTARARKIAVLLYNAIRHGMIYQDQGAAAYDERHRHRMLSNLRRRTKTLGCAPAPIPKAAVISQEGSAPREGASIWRYFELVNDPAALCHRHKGTRGGNRRPNTAANNQQDSDKGRNGSAGGA